jgi:hypothetical protein
VPRLVIGYFILTNRKRTVVALVHTVAFLLLAVRGAFTVIVPLDRASTFAAWLMPAVYLVVSLILLVLAVMSRTGRERLYFACCATSAAFGLLRQVMGDPRMHSAAYIRVVMLITALLVGWSILRQHGRVAVAAS